MSPESTDFLYPFIEGDERDVGSLLDDLAASARAKATESRALAHSTIAACAAALDEIAAAMAQRFAAGGRLFVFGNGGSSTDAGIAAALFAAPPGDAPVGRPLGAHCLVGDTAVLTALSNDVGFDVVFSRQLIAHGRGTDMALGISTSGNSDNLLRAFAEGRRLGMLTIGLAGYDGGAMGHSRDLDHCLVVRSESVHRVQETQAALVVELWTRVHGELGSPLS